MKLKDDGYLRNTKPKYKEKEAKSKFTRAQGREKGFMRRKVSISCKKKQKNGLKHNQYLYSREKWII